MIQFPNFEKVEFSLYFLFLSNQYHSHFRILSIFFYTKQLFSSTLILNPPLMVGLNQRIVICMKFHILIWWKWEVGVHLLSVNNFLLIKVPNFSTIRLQVTYTLTTTLRCWTNGYEWPCMFCFYLNMP